MGMISASSAVSFVTKARPRLAPAQTARTNRTSRFTRSSAIATRTKKAASPSGAKNSPPEMRGSGWAAAAAPAAPAATIFRPLARRTIQ